MKIKKMADEQVLDKFIKLLDTRVSITTCFTETEDNILTHQFLRITCGELSVMSNPELLEVPLRIATGADLGATVN